MDMSNVTFQVLTLSTFVFNKCSEIIIFTIIFVVFFTCFFFPIIILHTISHLLFKLVCIVVCVLPCCTQNNMSHKEKTTFQHVNCATVTNDNKIIWCSYITLTV